jgi:hypothetical protein
MNSVGGEERPLEDILSRLSEMSRAPRSIDLSAPPPVPSSHATHDSVPAEALLQPIQPAAAMQEYPQTTQVEPAPVDVPVVAASNPPTIAPAEDPEIIDLRAPEVAPTEPTHVVAERTPSRLTEAAAPETGGRYGRHAEVAFVQQRPAALPATVPLVPVSVRDDAHHEVPLPEAEVRTGPNWVLIAILFLLAIAVGAGLALLVR